MTILSLLSILIIIKTKELIKARALSFKRRPAIGNSERFDVMTIIKRAAYTLFILFLSSCGGSDSGPTPITSFAHLQSIGFESDSYSIIIGQSETVPASGGSGSGIITYESSDAAIASVSSSGVVTANALGSVTITATKAADNLYAEATATTDVTVTPKLDQTISFDSDTYSIIVTNDLNISVSGGEGSGIVTYSSSDESVATVSSSGVVSAVSVGSAIISATKAEDETYAEATAETTVNVTPKLNQSITFGEQNYTVVIGNSQTIAASGGPGTGTISYTTSDPNIATVNGEGLVTGIAIGNITLTAVKAPDSTYAEATATTTVTISDLLEQSISFPSNAYTLSVDETQTIVASGGEGTGSITYSSADTSVLTITNDGLVTAIGAGSTTITAVKAADGLYAEAFTTTAITVEPAAPDAPVITLTWVGNSRLTVSWPDVAGATSYNLYFATESVAALSFLENLESLNNATKIENVSSPYTIDGLQNNIQYFVAVTALTDSIESDVSNEVVSNPVNPLNDTGITVSGNGTSGINATCTKAIQNGGHVPQDCDQGRDADSTIAGNKVGTGAAAFDFTKLGSDGLPLAVQNVAWSANGNETAGSQWSCIRDNVTGLVWEIKTASGPHSFNNKVTWGNRNNLVATSNTEAYCGITTWRVPSLAELLTIAHNGRSNPAMDVPRFPNAKNQSYWTSDPVSGVTANAWTVNFFSGIGNSKAKTSNFQVRLIAGDYAASRFEGSRFIDNSDGTLTDLVTGLMWKRCPEGLSGATCNQGTVSNKVWGVAMKTARDSTFAGYDDWRLPNLKEMQTLVDVTKNNPAQDTSVFPNPKNVLNYWTSSLTKKNTPVTQSWRVNFQRGLSEFKVRTQSTNAQWLVRDAD